MEVACCSHQTNLSLLSTTFSQIEKWTEVTRFYWDKATIEQPILALPERRTNFSSSQWRINCSCGSCHHQVVAVIEPSTLLCLNSRDINTQSLLLVSTRTSEHWLQVTQMESLNCGWLTKQINEPTRLEEPISEKVSVNLVFTLLLLFCLFL